MLVVLKLLLLLFSYKMLPVSFQSLRGLSMSAVFVSHHRFLHKYDIADLFLNKDRCVAGINNYHRCQTLHTGG